MHVAWALTTSVFAVTMTPFVRARSLLPLATGWRTVHPWQSANRSRPHPFANDTTNEAHHVAKPR
ncbi:hypothetical protein Bphyt_0574 [Paraburkholderia phytofirmans PsJN]|uniref:Uncharacterized protein n=1 Tax=Paraburkholderia phytofirmans (strain DSM 17436 / LMG 22146 / PsJN) TaxID=398527 RepID=B2SXF4_PARPJ|nr:hypothetical protein Bphyt_0574 [Paraburkholderia phytofirmans PsJN]